jgi:hypothetical protein
MHHLTKSVFSCQLALLGVGNGLIVGEAGREFVEKPFAGVVCAIWDKGETAEMEKIRCLVLDYRGALRDLRKSCLSTLFCILLILICDSD